MLDSMSKQEERVGRLKTYMTSLFTYNPQWTDQQSNGACSKGGGNEGVNGTCNDICGKEEENGVSSPVSAECSNSSIEIEFADEKGRQLIASRDIMPGEVILKVS
ncbi:unnamed protein product, partial [Meganyctiphanes norvegica]